MAQARWAKPVGDWLHGIVAAIFGRMLPIRDFLAGTWLGHPLHALLTDVPIGALTLVIVLDVVGQPTAADVALLIGVLAMLAAALAGYADYSTPTGGRASGRPFTARSCSSPWSSTWSRWRSGRPAGQPGRADRPVDRRPT